MKPQEIKSLTQWAYFTLDGNVQVRSISDTKAIVRKMICKFESDVNYKDYEEEGYTVELI